MGQWKLQKAGNITSGKIAASGIAGCAPLPVSARSNTGQVPDKDRTSQLHNYPRTLFLYQMHRKVACMLKETLLGAHVEGETTLTLRGTSCLGCAGMGRELTCQLRLMLAALAWRDKHLLDLWTSRDGSPKPDRASFGEPILCGTGRAMQRLRKTTVQSRGCGRIPLKRLALAVTFLKHSLMLRRLNIVGGQDIVAREQPKQSTSTISRFIQSRCVYLTSQAHHHAEHHG